MMIIYMICIYIYTFMQLCTAKVLCFRFLATSRTSGGRDAPRVPRNKFSTLTKEEYMFVLLAKAL